MLRVEGDLSNNINAEDIVDVFAVKERHDSYKYYKNLMKYTCILITLVVEPPTQLPRKENVTIQIIFLRVSTYIM